MTALKEINDWLDIPAWHRYRKDGPETSKTAAWSLYTKNRHKYEIKLLRAFYEAIGGLNAYEATELVGPDGSACPWRRITDLKDLGLVRDTGTTRPGKYNNEQIVWKITDLGEEFVEWLNDQ